MARYLGALYKFDAFNAKKQHVPRSMLTSMDAYAANSVQRFVKEQNLSKVTSPYFSSQDYGQLGE